MSRGFSKGPTELFSYKTPFVEKPPPTRKAKIPFMTVTVTNAAVSSFNNLHLSIGPKPNHHGFLSTERLLVPVSVTCRLRLFVP